MKNTIKTAALFVALFVAFMMYSCKDEWNEHYDRNQSLPEQNLYELIKENSSLSKFARLVKVAGYDTLLVASQTFTVWAPTNEALAVVDEDDAEQVRLLVSNHIARFNHSTSEPDSKVIRMINGKVHYYSHENGLTFGGSGIVSKDQLAKNGILHTIDKQIVYAHNIYEYITTQSNTTKIFSFISKYVKEIKEEQGYDTITTMYNPLLENRLYGLGNIAAEDSVFTMIIPTDAAWDAAYERISPYFNVYHKDAALADSAKKVQTSLAIINDLIYRERIDNPADFATLTSTSGSVISDVNDLFSSTNRVNASNGVIYLADEIRYDNTETWNKPILVECEEQEGRVKGNSYTSIYTRTVSAGSVVEGVSGSRYIEVQSTSTTAQPAVIFNIPNVLSGKYNVYADFIPAIIEGEEMANDKTKLSFQITYMNALGNQQTKKFTSNDFVTSGTEITRIEIAREFEFPVSNYYDRLWMLDEENDTQWQEVTTKFKIETNVSSKEFNAGTYTRRFRVDRIIFEPVRNK
ncbi:fasciclin domain-containing protein [Bacteroides sp.]